MHRHSIRGTITVHSLVEELQIAHQSDSLVNDSKHSCSENVSVQENKLEEGMFLALNVISQLHNRDDSLVRSKACKLEVYVGVFPSGSYVLNQLYEIRGSYFSDHVESPLLGEVSVQVVV